MKINEQREKLVSLLKELFQLNQPDLDFGFYRIMHAKAKEVTRFLEKDLLKIVETAFGKGNESRIEKLRKSYEEAIETARKFGAPVPEETEPVRQAKAELVAAVDTTRSEGEVYDHLYRFFERYYENGDFISRRYFVRETSGKSAPYAVPYHGEEVKLHWANADQYYIKTTEYFTNFTFDLTEAKEIQSLQKELFTEEYPTPLRVHFRIVTATEGEHGNIKASTDQKRFFILHKDNPVTLENNELVIHFEYRNDSDKGSTQEGTWREKRNAEAVETIFAVLDTMEGVEEFKHLLTVTAPTEKQSQRTLLAKYINQYTARNTMDYFIHKDLGGFLRRELDFYIKNEVMRLDDIESADAPRVEQYLDKIKVLRSIAHKIIDFLAQLENYQKKLWLKKKFVVETNYCITLGRVPENLFPDIVANDAQREEWVRLFAIDEIQHNPDDSLLEPLPSYTVPLTVEFLEANKFLVVDTKFFDETFKTRLLASLENIDEQCDGLLIHSENFQVLNLLQERYREQVKCIYIDPPYNTGGDGFAYKDSYQHSSWLTMILERLSVSYSLIHYNGIIFSSIDALERNNLENAMDMIFNRKNRVEEIIWIQNTTKNQSPTYSTNHEYIEVYSKNIEIVKSDFAMFRETKPGFGEIMKLIETLNPYYYPITKVEVALRKLLKEHKSEISSEDAEEIDEWKGLYNYNRAEYRDNNGKYVDEANAKRLNAKIWVWREDNPSMPQIKEDSQKAEFRDINNPTYRFYNPLHPTTGKPCPAPKRGWSWPYSPYGKQKNCFTELAADYRISWGEDETKIPQTKRFLHEVETNVSKSVINDYTDGEKELTNLFGKTRSFGGPKPTTLIKRFCNQASIFKEYALDFFAGSGTTAHSIINLNREDEGKRKYILVEMGNHFDTVLKPRIQKVVYAQDWKDGKPVSRDTGVSHCFKYIRLEAYEDTLNNLEFQDDPTRAKLLEKNSTLREDYMLHYMLDLETRESQSLLNLNAFADPTSYKLKIKKSGSDEYEWKNVDLLETFNYLIGLRVEHIDFPQIVNARFKREKDSELPEDQNTRLAVDGKIKADPNGAWWFRKVEGWIPKNAMTPNDGQREKVLIVWRKLTGDIEKDNLMLDTWFEALDIRTRDFEFDTIYVNGSNNLPNLKREDETWKVRLIEEEFMKRMWDVEGM